MVQLRNVDCIVYAMAWVNSLFTSVCPSLALIGIGKIICSSQVLPQARKIVVDSVHDPKVVVVFDPKSLIQALDDLVGRHMTTNVKVV
ncbi:hypothetical protein RchiOBHm_Chr5g0010491 [Rosa chinensis]|uniref:Uncharacterized protein n=1 Tax=Rosa chinensis TaxID=74649 RepID=A0A2P6Q4K9_ROSCH|nr:hypothetical protein RchiOBHm_Chr5g0010491 [Rosa chinensis]